MLALLLLACGGKAPDSSASIADSAAADTSSGGGVDTSALASDLYGERPGTPVPLPDFTATNRDGSARGPADLRGHPTVLWFYPAAGTYG